MRRLLVPLLFAPLAVAFPAAAHAAPPTSADTSGAALAGEACAFPISYVLTGKTKTIDAPGHQIVIAPDQVLTVTNADNGKSATYVITGTFHNVTMPNGDVVTQATGRNALFDPTAGFVLVTGNFSYTNDKDGNNLVPFHGTGQVTDICEQIA